MRKPPNGLFRPPKAKRKKDDALLSHDGLEDYEIYLPALNTPAYNEEEDDLSSISSFSTTTTAENIPGAGRTVDMFFYQPVGRWIERLAMRLAISSLNPDQIYCYIEARLSCTIFCDTQADKTYGLAR